MASIKLNKISKWFGENHIIKDVTLNVENGDFVEILTHKSSHPSLDWLNYVATPTARNRIRQWYKKSHRQETISRGNDNDVVCLLFMCFVFVALHMYYVRYFVMCICVNMFVLCCSVFLFCKFMPNFTGSHSVGRGTTSYAF